MMSNLYKNVTRSSLMLNKYKCKFLWALLMPFHQKCPETKPMERNIYVPSGKIIIQSIILGDGKI